MTTPTEINPAFTMFATKFSVGANGIWYCDNCGVDSCNCECCRDCGMCPYKSKCICYEDEQLTKSAVDTIGAWKSVFEQEPHCKDCGMCPAKCECDEEEEEEENPTISSAVIKLSKFITSAVASLKLNEREFSLPIRKMEGVPVDVTIRTPINGYWYLRIQSDYTKCVNYDSDDEDADTSEVILFHECIRKPDSESNNDVAANVLKIINTFKYSKLTNKFVSPAELELHNQKIECFTDLFSSNVELAWDDCSVCMEKTGRKTRCKHSLCVPCHSSLKVTDGRKFCPICRENI